MDPKEYETMVHGPRKDFRNYIRKYSNKLNFNSYKKVLDVGCGPGNVTIEELLPFLPKNYEKLVGVDKIKKIIQHANSNYKIEGKIEFQEMDIATQDLPKDFQNKFDFIVSNACMHWVSDMKQSFQNMYDMLKPGGDIFILLLCKAPIFDIPKSLRHSQKFGSYFKNIEKMFSPAVFSERPSDFVQSALTDVGFNIQYCDLYQSTSDYTKKSSEGRDGTLYRGNILLSFLAFVHTFNSFDMPEDLADEFISIFVDRLKEAGTTKTINGEEIFDFPYSFLVMQAKK